MTEHISMVKIRHAVCNSLENNDEFTEVVDAFILEAANKYANLISDIALTHLITRDPSLAVSLIESHALTLNPSLIRKAVAHNAACKISKQLHTWLRGGVHESN